MENRENILITKTMENHGIVQNNKEINFEIKEGLKENWEIVTGGFLAISRELQDGDKVIQDGVSPEIVAAP